MSDIPSSPVLLPLSKQEIVSRFSRMAEQYASHAVLQAAIADELLANHTAHGVVLDAGCGRGRESLLLAGQAGVDKVIAMDMSPAMLRGLPAHPRIQALQADMENTGLPDSSIDTVFSNFAMQWCESPEKVMQEMQRVLKPDGQLMMSVPGPGSLAVLNKTGLLHVNQFATAEEWSGALQYAGFASYTIKQQVFTLWFDSAAALLKSIKGIGAGASQKKRDNHLQGKQWLRDVTESLEQCRQPEGLPLSYHVIFISAVKELLKN